MANYYTVKAQKAVDVQTKGAAERNSSTGEGVRFFSDSITTVDLENNDIIHVGPFRAGEMVLGNFTKIIGDATVDLGTDLDIGWAYVDGSGTADPDAFVAGTFDGSAAVIDVAGVNITDGTVDDAVYGPPTNDRDWWLTITVIDNTGEINGTAYVQGLAVNFR